MQNDKEPSPEKQSGEPNPGKVPPAPATSSAEGTATEAAPSGTAAGPLAVLEEEKKALHDRMLRIAADFENYKKRAKRDVDDAQHRAREQVLKELLPVADNLERALAHIGSDPQAVLDGVKLVLRQLESTLERLDVRPVAAVGTPFDPSHHEAIQQVETAEHAPGTVVGELQRGYTLGNRLLRPALVAVAKAASPAATGSEEGDGHDHATELNGAAQTTPGSAKGDTET